MEAIKEELPKLNLVFGKYKIQRLDVNNIIVTETKKKISGENVGQEYNYTLGFYGSIEQALVKVLKLISTQKDINSVKGLLKAWSEAQRVIIKALHESTT